MAERYEHISLGIRIDRSRNVESSDFAEAMAIELCYGHAISLNKNLSPSSIRYPKVSRKTSLKYECSIENSSSPIDVERQGNVKVLNLLKTLDEREKGDRKPSHYFEDLDINNTIDSLIEEYSNVASAEEYLTSGQGEWEVFYAPHIARYGRLKKKNSSKSA